MKKKNPTIGELQVYSGKLMWIMGSIVVAYELIKSIVDKNFINEWKLILAFAVFVGISGLALYFIGKARIEQGKKEEKVLDTNIHQMKLHPEPFVMIKNKTKTIEMRLNDEKRSLIKVNDIIVFTNVETQEKIFCKIEMLHKYDSFKELYQKFDKIKLGYKETEIADPRDMEMYYDPEKIRKYGVLGIEIKVIE